MSRLRAVALLLSGIGAIAQGGAVARPLDPEICRNLTAQRDELEARGVRQLVANGPAGNHSARQIADVRQFLDLEGQLRFRCPFDQVLAPLKEDVPEDAEGGAPGAQPDDAAAPTDAKAKGAPKKKVQPAKPKEAAVKEKTVSGSPTAPSEAKPSQPAAAKTPPPQPKATVKAKDDAYRPPAEGDPNSTSLDSQARQPK